MSSPQNIPMEVLEEQIKRWNSGPESRIHKSHSALQKFINDNKHGIKITDITIQNDEDTITLAFTHENGNFCVNYLYVIPNGCLIFMEGDEEKQPIELNFLTQLITDLARIIDLQKPNEPLNSITFTIDENFDLKFLEEIQNFLKIRNLKSQEVQIHCEKRKEILCILPFFNSESLQKIVIGCSETGVLSQELCSSAQWKNAKHLDISSVNLSDMDNFSHFSTVIASCDDLPLEDVVAVKEKFLQSSKLEHLEIFFETNDQTHNYKKHFGPNFQTWSGDRTIWFSRTPNSKRILRFEANPNGIKLNYTDDYKAVGERWINLNISSECNLLQMPLFVIRRICEKSNLESILSLRKVCRDLRDLLIEKNPNAKLIKIEININLTLINLKIYDSLHSEPLSITYKDALNGFTVAIDRYTPTSLSPEKFLDAQHFVDAFFEDLEIIMKHQKKILKNFSLTTRDIEISDVIDRLTELLKKHSRPMTIGKFELNMEKASGILQFLDDNNQKKQIYSTSLEAHCDYINFEELLAIKEKFLQCFQLENLELSFKNSLSHEYKKYFGSNFRTQNDSKIWISRTSSPSRVLQFEAKPDGIKMNYIPYNDVPESLINLTLSSDCYLLRMPIVVIKRILEESNLESILTLRKTCYGIRNLIDSKKPNGKIETVFITSEFNSISLQIYCEGIDAFTLKYCSVINGCMASISSYRRQKKEGLILGQNYVDIFFQDFEIIMSHQKDVLRIMSLDIKQSHEIVEKFYNYLRTRKNSIKVEHLYLNLSKQSQIVQFLSFFDSKSLQEIEIYFNDSNKLSEDLARLDQWKNASSAKISNFNLGMMKHCMHFKELTAHCDDTVQHARNIPAFKRKMHESSHLKTMDMFFDTDYPIFKQLGIMVTLENDGKEFVP